MASRTQYAQRSYHSGYNSDSQESVGARPRHSQRSRPRSRSANETYTYPSRQSSYSQQENGTRSVIPKAIVAVGLVALAAAMYHAWASKRDAARDAKERHERTRRFERAKARRRREDEIWERQQEEREAYEDSRVHSARRIEYGMERSHDRSASQRPKRLRTSSTPRDGENHDEGTLTIDQRGASPPAHDP